jgi:hypothetical protein
VEGFNSGVKELKVQFKENVVLKFPLERIVACGLISEMLKT